MAIFNIFSKRQKRLRGEFPDVYSYDKIPAPLRVQIIHIWHDAIGDDSEYNNRHVGVKKSYKIIVETLCREYGVFELSKTKPPSRRHYMKELINFFLNEEDPEKAIDVIELSFKVINNLTRKYDYLGRMNASEIADKSINELNDRFREHGIGYQFEKKIIRVDSQFVHSEVVKPALVLLGEKLYAGAQQEFLKAHEHYRQRNYKEALNESLKAFESTMKTICDKRGWVYDKRATAKTLIDLCYQNDLIPSFWHQHMAALRSLLEGGVPTGRNKLGGHGQGAAPIDVPQHIVAYVIHMAASCIVFLVEAEKFK